MNKTWIIIKREYLSRVKKKSFLIATLAIPLLFVVFGGLMGLIAADKGDTKNIMVVDESGLFAPKLKNTEALKYTMATGDIEEKKKGFDAEQYDGLLYVPKFDYKSEKIKFRLFYDEQPGVGTENDIADDLNQILTDQRMTAAGISNDQLKTLQEQSIGITAESLKDGSVKSNEAAMAIGGFCGFVLYLFLLLYGMSVMRSVTEEKTNRIAEIIVSSVKPMQLMLGKIIGVAMVGLTQVLIWIVVIVAFASIGLPMMTSGMAISNMNAATAGQTAAAAGNTGELLAILNGTNWLAIILWFVFYFMGGYFLYAALFAAVGSLVDEDPQASSQYTMPITLPIVFSFYIMFSALKNPNGSLAVFGSIFPLTSPIVMMGRIPFGDVPWWQLALSAALLVLGFLGTSWMAGKIYRTGILMYGKKVSFKEIGKWLVRK
ncbi:MAG: ABC transporter permease [Edaphocola sp.]